MIEPAMYFAIGFLVASLFALIFIPLVHSRAVRLTLKRTEAATPLSMTEIQADKDQLRAEFAMSTRRLEMSVEQMKAKTAGQLAELGKKTQAITRLKAEIGEKAAAARAIEERERAAKDQLRATEEEFAQRVEALHAAEQSLHEKEAELARLTRQLDERAVTAESHRIEMVAMNAQLEAMRTRVSDSERALKESQRRRSEERAETEQIAAALQAERAKTTQLAGRVADLEQQHVTLTADAEVLGHRAQDLETRLAEQGRLLAHREQQGRELAGRLTAAQQLETELRNETDTHKRALADLQRDAESSWAAERVENAMLRERINDIAAEIARLTAVLEGADSPIEQMLAAEPAQPLGANGDAIVIDEAAPGLVPGRAPGNLADRIRALQHRAGRAPNPS